MPVFDMHQMELEMKNPMASWRKNWHHSRRRQKRQDTHDGQLDWLRTTFSHMYALCGINMKNLELFTT